MYTSTVSLIVATCLVFVLATNVPVTQAAKTTAAPADDKHPASLLEKMPILELLKNPKVMDGYTGCILDKGPCTPDAAEVRAMMPEALTTGCAKCTPMQKQVTDQLIMHYVQKQPEILKDVIAKYDPKGEFNKKYLAAMKKSAKKQ